MKNYKFQSTLKLAIVFTIILFLQTIANAAAVIDRTFGANGTATTNFGQSAQASAMVIQPDGKIIVVGKVTTGDTGDDPVIVRYNSNGSLDASFGNGGIVRAPISPLNDYFNAVALQPDGKIVAVGSTQPYQSASDFLVVRYNTDGSLDSSFGANGVVKINQSITDIFNAVVVQPDGKIVAAGTTSENNSEFAAIRFNSNGTLDGSFANGGLFFLNSSPYTIDETFRAVALFPNGRILFGGTAWDNGGTDALVLLEPNGTFARDFANNGVRLEFLGGSESSGLDFDLAILPDGKFLADSRSSLRRYLANGTIDQSFRTLYAGGGNYITSAGTDLAVRSDGRIIVLNQRIQPSLSTVVYNNDGREINRVGNLTGDDVAIQSDNKFVIVSSSGNNFTVTRFVSITSPATRIADFDYDGKTDFIVSRSGEIAYVLRSAQGVTSYRLNHAIGEGVRVIPEDYYSNDPTQFPLFYWRSSTQNSPAYFDSVTEYGSATTYQWGLTGDIPVGGDYDGETLTSLSLFRKSTELAVFRPSNGTWYIFNRLTNTSSAIQWGQSGDKPVPADYDYDGITDVAVYRPSTGTWWIRRSSDGTYFSVHFGAASDIPLTGDFDGDGKADFVVYRPSSGVWYELLTTEGFRAVQFGLPTDIPVPGDYDGDGKHDIAVFRDGIWYLLQSTEGFKAVQWGTSSDSPISVRYDQ
ncbi:MAG: FG-GAP-like repeat-containing protein [Pyrinomonadaceae bacterium]